MKTQKEVRQEVTEAVARQRWFENAVGKFLTEEATDSELLESWTAGSRHYRAYRLVLRADETITEIVFESTAVEGSFRWYRLQGTRFY